MARKLSTEEKAAKFLARVREEKQAAEEGRKPEVVFGDPGPSKPAKPKTKRRRRRSKKVQRAAEKRREYRQRRDEKLAAATAKANVGGRWGRQILRVESNRDGLIHTDENSDAQRVNAFGRVAITAKWDATCECVRLGQVCGNPIKKGRRCFFEPKGKTIECRECWT